MKGASRTSAVSGHRDFLDRPHRDSVGKAGLPFSGLPGQRVGEPPAVCSPSPIPPQADPWVVGPGLAETERARTLLPVADSAREFTKSPAQG
jgi:hypothetical protein